MRWKIWVPEIPPSPLASWFDAGGELRALGQIFACSTCSAGKVADIETDGSRKCGWAWRQVYEPNGVFWVLPLQIPSITYPLPQAMPLPEASPAPLIIAIFLSSNNNKCWLNVCCSVKYCHLGLIRQGPPWSPRRGLPSVPHWPGIPPFTQHILIKYLLRARRCASHEGNQQGTNEKVFIFIGISFQKKRNNKYINKKEESSSWLKSLHVIFPANHRQVQRLYLAGSMGNICPSHSKPGSQPLRGRLWRELERTQAPLAGPALHMFVFLAPEPSFLGFFIWGLGQRSSSDISAKSYLWWKEQKHPEDHFSHSDSVLSTFPLLALFCCSLVNPLPCLSLLFGGPSAIIWPQYLWWSTSSWPMWWASGMGFRGASALWALQLSLLIILLQEEIKGLTVAFIFWLVVLISWSETWQLSCLQHSWAPHLPGSHCMNWRWDWKSVWLKQSEFLTTI